MYSITSKRCITSSHLSLLSSLWCSKGNCSHFPLHRYKHLNTMLKYHHILLVVCTVYHSNCCMFNECPSNLFVCVFNVQSNQFYAQPCLVCHTAAMREIAKVIIKINMEWVAEKISSSWWSLSGRAAMAPLLPAGMDTKKNIKIWSLMCNAEKPSLSPSYCNRMVRTAVSSEWYLKWEEY